MTVWRDSAAVNLVWKLLTRRKIASLVKSSALCTEKRRVEKEKAKKKIQQVCVKLFS